MRSFSNFKQYVFSHLFPRYFKENDTYKDTEGRGILERFIDICSNYLDTEVMEDSALLPGLHNIMDITDLDKTNPIFLNYYWEFFGFIPYMYGVLTNGQPYTKENFMAWVEQDSYARMSMAREALKYAVSLYKIRGTEKFYHILARFYGSEIEVDFNSLKTVDENGNEIEAEVVSTYNDIGSSYGDPAEVDAATQSKLSRKAYYTPGNCYSCMKLHDVIVKIPTGRYYQSLVDSDTEQQTKELISLIFSKYLPVQVKPLATDDIILNSVEWINHTFGGSIAPRYDSKVMYRAINDYNALQGSRVPYQVSSIEAVAGVRVRSILSKLTIRGLNQWDEQWRNDGYYSNNGTWIAISTLISSRNPIRVLPQTHYHLYVKDAPERTLFQITFWKRDGTFISRQTGISPTGSTNIVTPDECDYVHINGNTFYGNQYLNNVCFSLYNTKFNGTYEPYEEEDIDIPIDNMYDKEGNRLFDQGPFYGLLGNDEITADQFGVLNKAIDHDREAELANPIDTRRLIHSNGTIEVTGSTDDYIPNITVQFLPKP